jgi:hypothetical protein
LSTILIDVDLPMPPLEPTEAPGRAPRTIRLVRPPGPNGIGIFVIAGGRQSTTYVFREIRCDIGGRGFAVHRLGLGPLYHVRVGRPRDCSCDCLGFLQHRRCKHVLGLSALLGHGLV